MTSKARKVHYYICLFQILESRKIDILDPRYVGNTITTTITITYITTTTVATGTNAGGVLRLKIFIEKKKESG